MTGSVAVATLLCALCGAAGFKVFQDGIHDRRRGRPEARGWIIAGSYLIAVPVIILIAMVQP